MPVHDWTRVDPGLFHHFHQRWIGALSDELNAGRLPSDYFALAEQVAGGVIPDVLALRLGSKDDNPNGSPGLAVATTPPRARCVQRSETQIYARKANRVSVRHRHGQVVAVVELVSPGKKGSRAEVRALVTKTAELIRQGIHLLVVDLLPPTKRDPQGIHKAIWDEIEEMDYELPNDKPLTVVSYSAGLVCTAYIENVAVGDRLPDMPLFLEPETYVPAPLEAAYQTAWASFPSPLKHLLQS